MHTQFIDYAAASILSYWNDVHFDLRLAVTLPRDNSMHKSNLLINP